jgi:hypothetical protein
MEQSLSWEVNSHSASQEIPRVLGNPKVHYHVHRRTPMVSVLRQMHPIHTTPSLRSILISSYLCLGLLSGLFSSGFPTWIFYAFFMHATCPICLIGKHELQEISPLHEKSACEDTYTKLKPHERQAKSATTAMTGLSQGLNSYPISYILWHM